MKKLISVSVLILIASVTAYAADQPPAGTAGDNVHSIQIPRIPVPLKEGPGLDKVTSFCAMCHSTDYITMQPPFPRATWTAEVNKMIKVMGAPISEDDAKTIIDYLSTQYGTGK